MLAALAAQADPATWQDLDPAGSGVRLRDPRTGIVFRRVPAGEFVMGGTEVEEEQPPHRVRISRDYLLAETEVTVGQWRRYVEVHGGAPAGALPAAAAGDDLPMSMVSWHDAQAFCARYGYRLPTEAEWERACRGGLPPDQGPWLSADTFQAHAWFHVNAADGPRPVATRTPNPYGLHDMLGNLWEWCEDRYDFHYYRTLPEPAVDPPGPADVADVRVVRGGSWFSLPGPMPATRLADQPGARNGFTGFRPVRDVAR